MGGSFHGFFQGAALVAQVPEVAILAVDAILGGLDRHIVLGGIVERVLAAADVPLAPGGDDVQAWVEGHDGQLEADLVVALAGGAMGHGVGAFHLGDLDHALGDQRAGKRGAQQVFALVDGPGLHGGEDEVGQELGAQVFHVTLGGAGGDGLLLQAGQLVFLAQIGAETDDLAAVVVLEPRHDHAGVQAA